MARVGHQGFWVYGIQLFKLVYGFFRFNSVTPSGYRIFCASSMFGYTEEIWGGGGILGWVIALSIKLHCPQRAATYLRGMTYQPALKFGSAFLSSSWESKNVFIFFKLSIPSPSRKNCVIFIGCNFKSHASQVGLNKQKKDTASAKKGKVSLHRNISDIKARSKIIKFGVKRRGGQRLMAVL